MDNLSTSAQDLEPASRLARALALLLDDLIILVPVGIYSYLTVDDSGSTIRAIYSSQWAIFVFLIFKDVTGSSPGKLMTGLSIVQTTDYSKRANAAQTIIRNIFAVFLVGIEALVILFNPRGQRIGDLITKTTVVGRRKEANPTDADLVGRVDNDTSDKTTCVQCGSIIHPGETKCSKCGWSYQS